MKINTLYTQLLNRIRHDAKAGSLGRGTSPSRENITGDRRELSALVATLQKAASREDLPSPQEAQRLNRLEKEIKGGTYRVDRDKLAAAMLKPPEK